MTTLNTFHPPKEIILSGPPPPPSQIPGNYDQSDPLLLAVVPRFSVFMNLVNKVRSYQYSQETPKSKLKTTDKVKIGTKFIAFAFPDSLLSTDQRNKINSLNFPYDRFGSDSNKMNPARFLNPHRLYIRQHSMAVKKALLDAVAGKSHSSMIGINLYDGLSNNTEFRNSYVRSGRNDDEAIWQTITGNYYEDDYMFLIEISGPLAKV